MIGKVENKEVMLGAFFDIEGAFDSTSFDPITSSLIHRGIEETRCVLISSILRENADSPGEPRVSAGRGATRLYSETLHHCINPLIPLIYPGIFFKWHFYIHITNNMNMNGCRLNIFG